MDFGEISRKDKKSQGPTTKIFYSESSSGSRNYFLTDLDRAFRCLDRRPHERHFRCTGRVAAEALHSAEV